jgi:predicted alpha/beta hydrolase family esterase
MAAKFDELIIPGLFDSGPDHWQSHWLHARPQALKVELGSWDEPTPELWTARLDRAIARRQAPVVLVAHSLGCLAVAWWAQEASPDRLHKVRGALLVAPPDVDRPDAHRLVRPFAPAPRSTLPFSTMLVASRTDPYASFAKLAGLAGDWGAELIDAGDLGAHQCGFRRRGLAGRIGAAGQAAGTVARADGWHPATTHALSPRRAHEEPVSVTETAACSSPATSMPFRQISARRGGIGVSPMTATPNLAFIFIAQHTRSDT